MLKKILAHPSLVKMSPTMKTTIVVALIVLFALLLPYLPIRYEAPPSLTRTEPVPPAQVIKGSSPMDIELRGNSAPPAATKKKPTPTTIPDALQNDLSQFSRGRTNTLDDLDSLLEKSE